MERYTINCLDAELLSVDDFKSITRSQDKHLFYDKCNWLITELVKDSYSDRDNLEDFSNIHSRTLKKILGDRNYRSIINTLKQLELVEENPKYSAGKFSKSYRLTEKAHHKGLKKTPIYSNRFQEKLQNYSDELYASLRTNDLFEKLLIHTSNLFIVNQPHHLSVEVIKSAQEEAKFDESKNEYDLDADKVILKLSAHHSYFDAFLELNTVSDPQKLVESLIFFEPSISKYGRVYHLTSSIPRKVRQSMRTKKGEFLFEVDMSSAQPSILFLEWLRRSKADSKLRGATFDQETQLLLKLVLQGGIYKYIQDHSTFCKSLKYQDLKWAILSTLNAKKNPSEMNIELKRLFPSFMNWINSFKVGEDGHKEISHIANNVEASIFVEVYKRLPKDMFALIIHDSILTIEAHTEHIKDALMKRTLELYGDVFPNNVSLDKLFKVGIVSLKDDEMINQNK